MAQQYSLSVVPDASLPSGGHAFISVHGVATPPGDDQIMIRRHDHRDRHLGPAGWQGPEIKLKPLETRLDKGAWALRFGPEVVDVIDCQCRDASRCHLVRFQDGSLGCAPFPDCSLGSSSCR